jgi:hypothetical protein
MVLTACGAGSVDGIKSVKTNPSNSNFYKHWVHSYEEQNGDKVNHIFRPKGSKEFAPARFRMEFAFDQNGQCIYKFLSPTDRHELRDCIYTKINNKVYLYDKGGKSLSHLAFTLAEPANKDVMKMSYGVKVPAKPEKKKKQ